MSTKTSERGGSGILRLVWVPALISLIVTLLRLTGELLHWSETWFSTDTGGIIPEGMTWLVGITWLALPFGIYFAIKLRGANERPSYGAWAILVSLFGAVLVVIGLFFVRPAISFPSRLIYVWAVMAVGAAVQFAAWPRLARVVTAYGFAARIPVVVIMFLAMLGDWGTHYDYVGMPAPFPMPFWPGFFWLAFFPQLIFWVSFTIVVGVLCGTIASAVTAKASPLRAPESL